MENYLVSHIKYGKELNLIFFRIFQVREYYWGERELDRTPEMAQRLSDAVSDSSYSHPIDTAAKIHSMRSQAPVFVYHLTYRGENSLTELGVNKYPPEIVDKEVKHRVGNGDDLIYLFPVLSGIFRPLPHDDLVFSQRFIELIASFAK